MIHELQNFPTCKLAQTWLSIPSTFCFPDPSAMCGFHSWPCKGFTQLYNGLYWLQTRLLCQSIALKMFVLI